MSTRGCCKLPSGVRVEPRLKTSFFCISTWDVHLVRGSWVFSDILNLLITIVTTRAASTACCLQSKCPYSVHKRPDTEKELVLEVVEFLQNKFWCNYDTIYLNYCNSIMWFSFNCGLWLFHHCVFDAFLLDDAKPVSVPPGMKCENIFNWYIIVSFCTFVSVKHRYNFVILIRAFF